MGAPDQPESSKPPRLAWPRYVLAAVVLGIIISCLAVLKEARRIQDLRERDPLTGERPATPAATNVTVPGR